MAEKTGRELLEERRRAKQPTKEVGTQGDPVSGRDVYLDRKGELPDRRGMGEKIYDFVAGREDPEVKGTVEDLYPEAFGVGKAASIGKYTAGSTQDYANILKSNIPDIQFARDKYDRPIALRGDQRAYLNQPGLDWEDVKRTGADVGSIVLTEGLMRRFLPGVSMLPRVIASEGVISSGKELISAGLGAEQSPAAAIDRIALNMAIAPVAQAAGGLLGRTGTFIRKHSGIRTKISNAQLKNAFDTINRDFYELRTDTQKSMIKALSKYTQKDADKILADPDNLRALWHQGSAEGLGVTTTPGRAIGGQRAEVEADEISMKNLGIIELYEKGNRELSEKLLKDTPEAAGVKEVGKITRSTLARAKKVRDTAWDELEAGAQGVQFQNRGLYNQNFGKLVEDFDTHMTSGKQQLADDFGGANELARSLRGKYSKNKIKLDELIRDRRMIARARNKASGEERLVIQKMMDYHEGLIGWASRKDPALKTKYDEALRLSTKPAKMSKTKVITDIIESKKDLGQIGKSIFGNETGVTAGFGDKLRGLDEFNLAPQGEPAREWLKDDFIRRSVYGNADPEMLMPKQVHTKVSAMLKKPGAKRLFTEQEYKELVRLRDLARDMGDRPFGSSRPTQDMRDFESLVKRWMIVRAIRGGAAGILEAGALFGLVKGGKVTGRSMSAAGAARKAKTPYAIPNIPHPILDQAPAGVPALMRSGQQQNTDRGLMGQFGVNIGGNMYPRKLP
jgi:hypothetical protein